ncbi:MAG: hypothetical protein EBZ36_15525, partial [Acidobacteria bacterium]|nr:hypothetical protein [Acidobacteriota bacterium]
MTIPFLVLLLVAVTAGCNGLVGADELEIGSGQRQLKLDPRVNSDDQDQELHALIFNGLTRRGAETEVVPDLAESFAASPDQRRFTFRLRKGVRFHNDRELSSLDVRYTYATMMRSDFISDPKERLGEIIDSIEVPDSNTVVFL